MKKISIIIPAYNASKFINNSLNSVKRIKDIKGQIEVVVVNDGSKDNTESIVLKYIHDNSNMNIKLISQENKGVSNARNNGIKHSKNDYLIFLDADDLLDENFLSEFNMINENFDIFIYLFEKVNNKHIKLTNYHKKYLYDNGLKKGLKVLNDVLQDKIIIWTASMVYNKFHLIKNNISYADGHTYGEDKDFQYRALMCDGNVYYKHKVLSYYVSRDGSLMNSYNYRFFDSINLKIKLLADFNKFYKSSKYFKSIKKGLSNQISSIFLYYYYKLYSNFKKIPIVTKRKLKARISAEYPDLFSLVRLYIIKKNNKKLTTFLSNLICYYTPYIYLVLKKIQSKIRLKSKEI